VNRRASLIEPDSHENLAVPATAQPVADGGPFGWLPRVTHRQLALERCLERFTRDGGLPLPLDWLKNEIGVPIEVGRPEIRWRASGLGRPGLVAQMTASRLATRLAIGVEIPLAHTVVDHLLGFDRTFAENRLQLTPVEWGVWTFLFLRALDSFDPRQSLVNPRDSVTAGQLDAGELAFDRVSPDAFDPSSLGSIVTVRWPVRIGTVAAAVRLWLPESLASLWLAAPRAPGASARASAGRLQDPLSATDDSRHVARADLGSSWRAVAGVVTMPQGLRRLRTGAVLPLIDTRLTGKPASPSGSVDLVLDLDGQNTRFRIPTRPVADSGSRLVRLESGPLREFRPRDPFDLSASETKPMGQPQASSVATSAEPAAAPLDVPVTLTVELGRVNLTLSQIADLKPGDVVELNRHSRAPVELTSNGRLVARGELIMIDTDLGVRVTSVFL
jgi:flagellar motor switch protein FliN